MGKGLNVVQYPEYNHRFFVASLPQMGANNLATLLNHSFAFYGEARLGQFGAVKQPQSGVLQFVDKSIFSLNGQQLP
jgi:hypothetical protein